MEMRKLTGKAAILAAVIAASAMSATAGDYYKLGSDAASQTSFSGTYSGGGNKIGWASSRDATTTVTPTDMANSDFYVVSGTSLRTNKVGGNYTFPGKSLVLESGGIMNVKAGEGGGSKTSSFTIRSLVSEGGIIDFNAANCSHTINGGTVSISSGSSLALRFTGSNNSSGIIDSALEGDGTTTLYIKAVSGNTATMFQFSDAAGFFGTIEDGGTGAANEKTMLKLTGGFGGTITSLPAGTTQVLVNYDGLPDGKGLRIATTTIPEPLKTTVTFYSESVAFTNGCVLMTFPEGTTVDPSEFTVKYAYGQTSTAVAFANLKTVLNADGTVSLAADVATYYKKGSDAANKNSFGGTYTGGGTSIGWADSRTATATVTPTDMGNADFVVINGTLLRTSQYSGNYTFPGKTLIFETGGSMTVKAGEGNGNKGSSTFAVSRLVGAGGEINFNAVTCTHTFTGNVTINHGSSLYLRFTGNDNRVAILNSALSGDETATLYLGSPSGNGNPPTMQFSSAAAFRGTIADINGGTGAVNEKLILKLTGGFGGTITSLPAGTAQVLVNYDGLPAGKGLRVATTTIPAPLKTTVTFYSSTAAFLSDGFVLMTFPSGTVVDPSAFTVKYAGSASETARTFAHLKKIDNADGTVSLAVSNESDFPAAGETIDLAGTSRTFPVDWTQFCAGFTVTDTVGGGEAHVSVDAGVTVRNTRMTLAGKLKFVKEGGGTFVSALSQSYIGGNLIVGGVAMPPQGGGTGVDYMPVRSGTYWKTFGDFTVGGDAAVIRVNTNGVFDINGVYGFHEYDIILNGGTLRNSTDEDYYELARPGVAIHSLEADSTLDVKANTRYWDGTSNNAKCCNLNGHVLDVVMANSKIMGVSTSLSNGTIRLSGTGQFKVMTLSGTTQSEYDMSTVDFIHGTNGDPFIDAPFYVRDYVCDYTGGSKRGGSEFRVYGTFRPNTQKFWPPKLMDKSAIDLSGKSESFATKSGVSAGSISFEAGATITLITGERRLRTGNQLMSWVSGAEPDATVKFVPQPDLARAWRFQVRADGVYVVSRRGFMILVK